MRLPGSKNKEKEGRNRVGRNATCVILKSCVELEGHNTVAFTSALPKHESHCQVQGFPWGNWMKVLTHTHIPEETSGSFQDTVVAALALLLQALGNIGMGCDIAN